MNVTSMLSAGYLEPSARLFDAVAERREAEARRASEERALAVQEDDILAQERELKAAGNGQAVHTTYTYTIGEDGRRYITGASVTMKDEESGAGEDTSDTKHIRGSSPDAGSSDETDVKSGSASKTARSNGELSESEKQLVQELKQADREVRAHEAAHMAAAGALGGGASYTYTKGPDGVNYATAGEVPIQMKEGSTPEETLRNMQQVQRAANAPANPSGQDRSVAAAASAKAAQARAEITKQNAEKAQGSGKSEKIGDPDKSGKTGRPAAKGTPVMNDADNEPRRADPSKKGASSVIASVREAEIQDSFFKL